MCNLTIYLHALIFDESKNSALMLKLYLFLCAKDEKTQLGHVTVMRFDIQVNQNYGINSLYSWFSQGAYVYQFIIKLLIFNWPL